MCQEPQVGLQAQLLHVTTVFVPVLESTAAMHVSTSKTAVVVLLIG